MRPGTSFVIFGPDYRNPVHVSQVVGFDYPKDPASGFNYNPSTYEDDIGVLYLADEPPFNASELHRGVPGWQALKDESAAILIVGFGYNVLNGGLVGLGVKREAIIHADALKNRTFAFALDEANTCSGDSGGPAFVERQQQLFLVGITSIGDEECTEGVNTRVDAYEPWLSARLQ